MNHLLCTCVDVETIVLNLTAYPLTLKLTCVTAIQYIFAITTLACAFVSQTRISSSFLVIQQCTLDAKRKSFVT